jgi:hypothetical protein
MAPQVDRIRIIAIAVFITGAAVAKDAGVFGGSLRSVLGEAFYRTESPGCESGFVSRSALRLVLQGRPAGWLWFEAHAVQDADFSPVSGNGLPGVAESGLRYRALDSAWKLASEPDVSARLWADRISVKLSVPWADLTVGRQAISFGKAYFWNPLDIFLPFDPRSFDRDYKPGVDALKLDVPLADFAGFNIVAASGRKTGADGGYADGGKRAGCSWYGSALMARVFAGIRGWDLAIQGGKVYGGWQAGGGFAGEAGPMEIRGEAAYLKVLAGGDRVPLPSPDDNRLLDDRLEAVVGTGRKLTPEIQVEAEYLYNGAGLPRSLAVAAYRVVSGNSLGLSRHLVGATVAWEAHPLVNLRLSALVSPADGSGTIQPGLTVSISDESDFMAGAQVVYGRKPDVTIAGPSAPASEFGGYPHLIYGEFKVYF